jgi:hypothetical protein
MSDNTDRDFEGRDNQGQTESRGKSHPSTEMGTHLGDSQREVGAVPRGGEDSPNDVSQQPHEAAQQQGETEER